MAEAATPKKKIEEVPEKLHVWPYLVRLEFLCALVVIIALTVWSIVIDAPLEEAANPTKTPNPSKAPWYFLGLQDILVYFDPWFAGVIAPVLIIVGLMLIPYLDVNPKGNGYYTYHERKVAIWVYSFGFLVLWIALIIMGVFLRGPGWNLFMPWQYWDPHKVVALVNVDLPYAFGFRDYTWSAIFGGAVLMAYFGIGTGVYFFMERKLSLIHISEPTRPEIQLALIMVGMVIKIVLRIGFNIKYIMVTPWISV